jgi:hypothetical protein
VIGRELNGPDELVWRPRLAAELDDRRAAVDWSLDGDGDHAVRIVAALAIQAAQQDKAGIDEWAERCATAAQTAPAPLRASVLAAAAFNQFRRGDPAALSTASDARRDGLPAGWPATYLPHMTLGALLGIAGHDEEMRTVFADGRAALDAISAPPTGTPTSPWRRCGMRRWLGTPQLRRSPRPACPPTRPPSLSPSEGSPTAAQSTIRLSAAGYIPGWHGLPRSPRRLELGPDLAIRGGRRARRGGGAGRG